MAQTERIIALKALTSRVLSFTGEQTLSHVLRKIGSTDGGAKLNNAIDKKVEGKGVSRARIIGTQLGQNIVDVYNRKVS